MLSYTHPSEVFYFIFYYDFIFTIICGLSLISAWQITPVMFRSHHCVHVKYFLAARNVNKVITLIFFSLEELVTSHVTFVDCHVEKRAALSVSRKNIFFCSCRNTTGDFQTYISFSCSQLLLYRVSKCSIFYSFKAA